MTLFFTAGVLIQATLGCSTCKPDIFPDIVSHPTTTTQFPHKEKDKVVLYNVTFTDLGTATGQLDPRYPDVIDAVF